MNSLGVNPRVNRLYTYETQLFLILTDEDECPHRCESVTETSTTLW